MAGIDILNQFPNSKMAAAARLGQSRFASTENAPAVAGAKSGVVTLPSVTGNTSTAALLTAAGLASSFSSVMFTIVNSAAGVPITVGGGPSTRYVQGQTATFSNVSTSANQLQVGTVAADVVTMNYVGV